MLLSLARQLLAQPQPLRTLLAVVLTVPLASVLAVGSAFALYGLVEPIFGATLARPAFLLGYGAAGFGTIHAVDRGLHAVWPAHRR